jgi:hypothetical protein
MLVAKAKEAARIGLQVMGSVEVQESGIVVDASSLAAVN